MTAKERLLERISALSEEEATEYLRVLDRRADPMLTFLDSAPPDDEPIRPDEEAAIREGLDASARGDVVSLEELKAELGL